MKWSEIKKSFPDKFVLIGDIVEEKISETRSKVIEGTVLEISDNGNDIRKYYRQYRKMGKNVLFSLPSTSDEFIIENIPYKGIVR